MFELIWLSITVIVFIVFVCYLVTDGKPKELMTSKKSLQEEIEGLKRELKHEKQKVLDLQYEYKMAELNLNAREQAMALEEKYTKDKQLVVLKEEIAEHKATIAELKAENKTLKDLVDINGDILDVKERVGALLNKLPEVKINGGLMLQSTTPNNDVS